MGRKPLSKEQRAATRTRILAAARDAFVDGGPRGVSMRGVAGQVGLSAMTIYLYFDNRRDILMALIREGMVLLTAAMQKVVDEGHEDPVERIRFLGRAYLDFAAEHPQYYQALFSGAIDDEPLTESEEGTLTGDAAVAMAPILSALTEIMDAPTAMGRAIVLWSTLHGFAQFSRSGRLRFMPLSAKDAQQTIEDILLQVVATGQPAS